MKTANELKESFNNHLQDLRDFALLSDAERKDVFESVRIEIVTKNYDHPILFPVVIEFIARLMDIEKFPELYRRNLDRLPIKTDISPQAFMEKLINERFANNDAMTETGVKWKVADKALFICFGNSGLLSNRSIIIIQTISGESFAFELPFSFGDKIALNGFEALARGRVNDDADFERFKTAVGQIFDGQVRDEMTELYKKDTFTFYSFGSVRTMLDTLDDITLSDDTIED